MPKDKRVILGMSGGVDSSVAAALLQAAGYEVFGLSMELYSCDRPMGSGCCTPKDRLDARKVCELLNIPFAVVDLRHPFRQTVLNYFAAEYARGRTPLPCVPCNAQIRFKALLDYADRQDAAWIATGHYARVRRDAAGSTAVWRAKDLRKDQSYFLWGLDAGVVNRLILPIGDYTKGEVRTLARKFGLPVSEKEESQDLCFVGEDRHAQFLVEHFPEAVLPPGDFVDSEGGVLGRHQGVHAYTVGQRKRLGISMGERQYVVRLDAAKNKVVLGPREALRARGLIAKDVHWISEETWGLGSASSVKIRSTHPGVAAQVEKKGEDIQVTFEQPQEAVTPGQAAVFYDENRLLGGAWIERAIP